MKCFICFDIGGSKIDTAIYQHKKDNYERLFSFKTTTKKGLSQLQKRLSFCFAKLRTFIDSHGYSIDSTIYIAMVGEFGSDYILQPGSAPNICLKENEFDFLDLNQFFSTCFGSEYSFKIVNDAIAQCCGAMEAYQLQLKRLSNHKMISFLGLGTGLGGAFCFQSSLLKRTFITDGHVSRILMQSEKDSQFYPAEALVSNVFFIQQFKKTAKEVLSSSANLKKYSYEITCFKNHFYTLLNLLFATVSNTHQLWSADDIKRIKRTSLLIIGGSIGCSKFLKDHFFYHEKIKRFFKNNNLELFILPDNSTAGTLGAYLYFKSFV